jgi:PadR family transcriptional regulator, regulatory protein PadR
MSKEQAEPGKLLQGTLDLLVLKTLSRHGVMHGFDVARSIQRASKDALQVEEGSLYPALYRLELDGFVVSEWGHAPSGKRARFYRLSAKGRKKLDSEESRWMRMVEAIGFVLAPETD